MKTQTCHTCSQPIMWLSGEGWVHTATRQNESLEPVEHRAFIAVPKAPARYLSRPEVAERIGVQPDTLNRYKLPDPDAQIGARQVGWLPATIDAWNAARPGRRGPAKPQQETTTTKGTPA